ncbi:MAG: crossover junction endodeoxyribonuclease RuvC [Minisyncoccia bacterium]
MKVLALDPGYDRLGVAILEKNGNEQTLLYSSCIETDRTLSIPDRLLHIGTGVASLLHKYSPEAVAIETIFFNKNIKTAIGVAEARGIIIFLARQAGCTLYEFGPQEIKVAITGYGKSDKLAVIAMVKRLVKNAPQEALDDEYDAIAVGITALAHHRF